MPKFLHIFTEFSQNFAKFRSNFAKFQRNFAGISPKFQRILRLRAAIFEIPRNSPKFPEIRRFPEPEAVPAETARLQYALPLASNCARPAAALREIERMRVQRTGALAGALAGSLAGAGALAFAGAC